MYRELTKEEMKELRTKDCYVLYRCLTELDGQPAIPPYHPVIDTEISNDDIRRRVKYIRSANP